MVAVANVGTCGIANADVRVELALGLYGQLYTCRLIAVTCQYGVILDVERTAVIEEAVAVALANDFRSVCDFQR